MPNTVLGLGTVFRKRRDAGEIIVEEVVRIVK
jgi:hypothetical protein